MILEEFIKSDSVLLHNVLDFLHEVIVSLLAIEINEFVYIS